MENKGSARASGVCSTSGSAASNVQLITSLVTEPMFNGTAALGRPTQLAVFVMVNFNPINKKYKRKGR